MCEKEEEKRFISFNEKANKTINRLCGEYKNEIKRDGKKNINATKTIEDMRKIKD